MLPGENFQTEKIVIVNNLSTKEITTFVPKAVESCMNPGTFMISPIVFSMGDNSLLIKGENREMEITLEDLAQGKITIEEQDFIPKTVRNTRGCKPCTNCGRC